MRELFRVHENSFIINCIFFFKTFLPHTGNNSCIVGAFTNIESHIQTLPELEKLPVGLANSCPMRGSNM